MRYHDVDNAVESHSAPANQRANVKRLLTVKGAAQEANMR